MHIIIIIIIIIIIMKKCEQSLYLNPELSP